MIPYNPGVPDITTSTYISDQLEYWTRLKVTNQGIIAAGHVLKRGTPLSYDDATMTYSPAASEDVAVSLLAFDIDTTAGTLSTGIYDAGEFNSNYVVLGAFDLNKLAHALRLVGIHLKTAIPAFDMGFV
jgi:hypothetical protein